MIFDSTAMQELLKKYAGEPNFQVPNVVLLGRLDELTGERDYIEELAQSVPEPKQKEWIGRLLNIDEGQHLSAWFEILLYGWLRKIGMVEVEPKVAGCYPDFSIDIVGNQVMIEARTVLVDDAEYKAERQRAKIQWVISKINLPYVVCIQERVLGESVDTDSLQSKVIHWLNGDSIHPFYYQDELGNKLFITAQKHPTLKHVELAYTGTAWISPEPLRPILHKKARQHKALRRAGYPYIVAVLLESYRYSAEEVAEAWFGRPEVIIDINSEQVVEERVDGSGLHFFGSEVRHKTVSGTLVCKASYEKSMARRRLRTWYIQNPYASTPVKNELFPVEGRFVVVNRGTKWISMDWEVGPANS